MPAVQAKFVGLERVVGTLRKLAAKSRTDHNASVAVGYTAAYALFVHENLQAIHQKGKTAKYLETPARQLQNDGTFATLIVKALTSGQTMAQGLLLAGLRLQRESQKIVPVDTGLLKSSAFTSLDD